MERLPIKDHHSNAIENIFKSFIALFHAEENLKEALNLVKPELPCIKCGGTDEYCTNCGTKIKHQ